MGGDTPSPFCALAKHDNERDDDEDADDDADLDDCDDDNDANDDDAETDDGDDEQYPIRLARLTFNITPARPHQPSNASVSFVSPSYVPPQPGRINARGFY